MEEEFQQIKINGQLFSQCEFCLSKFEKEIAFKTHVLQCHRNEKRNCFICKTPVVIAKIKGKKMNRCNNCRDKVRCKNCNRVFSEQYFKQHYVACINKEFVKLCDKCNTEIDVRSFKNHYRACQNLRQCNFCKEKKDIEDFHRGAYRCKDCLKLKDECQNCGKNFQKHLMKGHLKSCSLEGKNLTDCSGCNLEAGQISQPVEIGKPTKDIDQTIGSTSHQSLTAAVADEMAEPKARKDIENFLKNSKRVIILEDDGENSEIIEIIYFLKGRKSEVKIQLQ